MRDVSYGVTAKGVYVATGRLIQFLDTTTGKRNSVADNVLPFGLCVSPDDRYVVWSQLERFTTDLMLVENFR